MVVCTKLPSTFDYLISIVYRRKRGGSPAARERNMKDKQLKRLNRAELLELLLEQTRETEALTQKLEQTEALLAERNLKLHNAGDLAQAVIQINGVMEAAQAAAQQYLDNIAQMEQDTRLRCREILNEALETAQWIRTEAGLDGDEGKARAETILKQLESIR